MPISRFPYQHVYECLHSLEHFQCQQEQRQGDLQEELNHQIGSSFEEEKAANNQLKGSHQLNIEMSIIII